MQVTLLETKGLNNQRIKEEIMMEVFSKHSEMSKTKNTIPKFMGYGQSSAKGAN